ncbi:hypothetical protein I317_07536 [Kwoniella heveanensis CBS 569]|nr:hypothetical protein I317_07536 [Kwoniella heveanensis CBS 569]
MSDSVQQTEHQEQIHSAAPERHYLSSPPTGPAEEIRFEIYYGVSSPWALLGAPEAVRIAQDYGVTVHLKPITVVEENGGIRLKTRHPARQAYHALDLARYAKHLNIPLKPSPKYYPPAPGTIELSGQAIIRVQRHYGIGSEQALRFSYAIQRCIWVTESGDYADVEVLKGLAREVGIEEEVVQRCVVDKRGDEEDEGVAEWKRNHEEAVDLGIFGTPNYVINGEIFWGQDRLNFVELRLKELVEKGAKPVRYWKF